MNIYSCIDNKNIDKIYVLFYSCYTNCSDKSKIKFYLLLENEFNIDELKIPDFLKDKLFIKHLDINYLKKNNWLKLIEEFNQTFYIQGHKCNHIMNFSRFFIFYFFPELERVVYLDWDMTVEADILNLNEEYNSDNLVVATPYKKDFKTICGNIGYLNKKQLKIICVNLDKVKDYNSTYLKNLKRNILLKYDNLIYEVTGKKKFANKRSFNAGFYIVSKKTFDQNHVKNIVSNLLKIQKKEQVFRFGTQVIMNLISLENIQFVDNKWNNIPKDGNFINHWNGLEKPWVLKDERWIKYFNKLNNS